jgi:hypothetical protein
MKKKTKNTELKEKSKKTNSMKGGRKMAIA